MEQITNLYEEYIKQEYSLIANLSNISAILYNRLPDINWLGFYLADNQNQKLTLGPFQGLQATSEIDYQSGVCGKCATTEQTIIVPDVHCFDGHIACDLRSKSEIVIPIFNSDNQLFALLDVDSPIQNRFGLEEQQLFEDIAEKISKLI